MSGDMSEAQFTAAVLGAAARTGWLTHHDGVSALLRPYTDPAGRRRWARVKANARAGFPDVVALHARHGVLLFAELKRDVGPRGGGPQPTPDQQTWLDGLRGLRRASAVVVALWRPADLDAVYAYLAEPWAVPCPGGL